MDKKQRVQFDLSEDTLEILDALKARTDVSTRAEAVRNAIKFHYDHLPTGPRRLVLGTVTPVPNETQSMIELRLGDVARHLCTAGFKREEVLQVCLTTASDVLDELCHIYDPPINPMSPEMVIAKAIQKAMDEYERTSRAAKTV